MPLNHSSTNDNTQIDLCFANFNDLDCRYYENYFGHHKPITCILNKPKQTQSVFNENLVTTNFQSYRDENISIINQIESNNEASMPSTSESIPTDQNKNTNARKCKYPRMESENNFSTGHVSIHPFSNNDHISCYANSTIQCLTNCESLISILQNYRQPQQQIILDSNDRTFSEIMLEFTNRNQNTAIYNKSKSSFTLREFAGEHFINTQ